MARHLIPNSTQIPDVILDHWMARLSGAEFKVLLYIARRTYGFGKDYDRISLSQLAKGITKRDGSVLDHGTGINRATVARALRTLEDMGIVIRETNQSDSGKEYAENTYSINLAWEPGDGSDGSPFSIDEENTDSSSSGVVAKCDQVVAKKEARWSQNETGVVAKCDPQETDLQETAATTFQGNAAADFRELVEKLTSNGVGHSIAKELARSHPEACRRCLEYLPFAKIRSSKGAFLANAIRHGYGPPKGYEEARQRLDYNGADSAKVVGPISPRIGKSSTSRKESDLRATLLALREKAPEEHDDFLAFEEEHKIRIERFAQRLSAKRRNEVLCEWKGDEKRLDRYERWLRLRVGHGYGRSLLNGKFAE